MDAKEHGSLQNTLDNLYEHWRSIRAETIAHLGGQKALGIIDFHGNNWIGIVRWILSKYDRYQQMNIVLFQFSRLFKEIYWLQFLFHTGNYATAYRNLRYILELMSQAYYVDMTNPGLTLDEQIEKASEVEERVYGWKLINSVLCKVLNKTEEEIQISFKPLWDELNRHVHPSAKQMDLVAAQDFSGLITDSFNTNLARDLLRVTDKVFDIVYAIVFNRFSKAKKLALAYEFIHEWEECLPNTMGILRQ